MRAAGIWIGLVGLLGVGVAPTVRGAEPAVGRRPNVVFLLTDDHRFDALGCMGNPIVRTPNIDALAKEGVVFRNAFVTTSICMTSRASILTGQYARRHGVNDFANPLKPEQTAQTYPALLRQAGYRTGFVGKFGVGDRGPSPAAQFDYYKGFPGQGNYWPKPAKAGDPPVHLTDLMTAQAVEFIAGSPADRPFCLAVSYKAPHAQDTDPRQYLYPPRLAELYKDVTIPVPATATQADFERQPAFLRTSESRRRWGMRFATPESYQEMVKAYYRLITQVDESVGEIVAALRKAGVAENTVVMLIGDNGYYFGEHGLADKWFPHEESIRVPLVVYDPRLAADRRGAVRTEMVLNIDVAPTLLGLAGAAAPAGMQGRDLTPLLGRGPAPADWRREFFYEHLFEHKTIPKSEGVRTGRYAYWRYLGVGEEGAEHLYNLETDPGQTRNLIAEPGLGGTVAELRGKAAAYARDLR